MIKVLFVCHGGYTGSGARVHKYWILACITADFTPFAHLLYGRLS